MLRGSEHNPKMQGFENQVLGEQRHNVWGKQHDSQQLPLPFQSTALLRLGKNPLG